MRFARAVRTRTSALGFCMRCARAVRTRTSALGSLYALRPSRALRFARSPAQGHKRARSPPPPPRPPSPQPAAVPLCVIARQRHSEVLCAIIEAACHSLGQHRTDFVRHVAEHRLQGVDITDAAALLAEDWRRRAITVDSVRRKRVRHGYGWGYWLYNVQEDLTGCADPTDIALQAALQRAIEQYQAALVAPRRDVESAREAQVVPIGVTQASGDATLTATQGSDMDGPTEAPVDAPRCDVTHVVIPRCDAVECWMTRHLSANEYALILIAITTFYVVKGGMFSVVITEVIQFCILSVASLAIGIIAMVKVSPENCASSFRWAGTTSSSDGI